MSSPPAQSANLGSIRIKYKYSAQVVLPAESYDPFIKAISGNQFQLPVVLGKVSNEREDAAWAMVKAFDYYGGVIKCITQIANHEVQTTCTTRGPEHRAPVSTAAAHPAEASYSDATGGGESATASGLEHDLSRQLDGVQSHRRVHENDRCVHAHTGAATLGCVADRLPKAPSAHRRSRPNAPTVQGCGI